MKITPWWMVVAVCAIGAPYAGRAAAQPARRELVGIVRDTTGVAIEGATVDIQGATARTNAKGAFQLWTADIDTLTISVRRLGFNPVSAMVAARHRQWDTVVVEMEANPQILAALTVKGAATRRALGLRDFDERRAQGLGIFVTRAEITDRNVFRPSDVLRNKRGVHLVRLANGYYGVRFAAYSSGRRASCTPDIWIDGQMARGMEIDDVSATDIEGMELYESFSSVPFEFTPRSISAGHCGTIVVWTRVPGP
jgi:hypothetical protein